MKTYPRIVGFLTWVACCTVAAAADAQLPGNAAAAQAYRKGHEPVTAQADGAIICEAEEFHVETPGWQARPWGTNYYAATFANCFLSRKAYLGAPEQAEHTVASIDVQVPQTGKYMVLVRYEAVYRFETQFKVQIDQQGQRKLDKLYGARDNLKVWGFRQQLKKEVAWPWGAVENVVWEGYPAELAAGPAKLSLVADKQHGDAARRNIDLVLLTRDLDGVQQRIEKENYLPLDGLLTQSGDVYLKVHNTGSAPLTVAVPPGTEHSPYWVHQRTWKPISIVAAPGQSSEWTEVGSNLDSLNDGQWLLSAKGEKQAPVRFSLEFGVRDAAGKVVSIKRVDDLTGDVPLAYDADTRYSRRIRRSEDVLYDLVDYLKKHGVTGTPPKRTLVYGYTFQHDVANAKWNAALDEFVKLIGGTALTIGSRNETGGDGNLVRGYIDLRGQNPEKLAATCQQLKAEGKDQRMAVVSLGDEIGLAAPPANDQSGFRTWLKSRGVNPVEVDPACGGDWEKIAFSTAPDTAKTKPALYYYSQIYGFRYGIARQKELTDVLRRSLPNAGIGANFSPHHNHLYLGPTYQWISLFREQGMTMPWGEDYIWQVPVGTQQMNSIMVDMFRAGIRGQKDAKIHYYVMPHTPGNTPASWRRQFYGTLAHGAKILNLFEFRPVQAAYTENHTSDPAMYQEVRRGLHELGRFEDLVQDGQVRPGAAALWCSEAADVWDDQRAPFDAAKRTLYIAIRHQQLPLDIVIEGDDLRSYKLLYLTDQHVSRAASTAIAAWVAAGGRLLATAGAGMYDEFNAPNKIMQDLLGVGQQSLVNAPGEPVRLEKQDLPFATVMDRVVLSDDSTVQVPVIGLCSKLALHGAEVQGKFASDNSPAITVKKAGAGSATCFAFLAGLSYFHPAIPRRPVDRGATDDSMAHFVPTAFDPGVTKLLAQHSAGVDRPVVCSEPLVETTVIESPHGTLFPLINWSGKPVKELKVAVQTNAPATNASLSNGTPVQSSVQSGMATYTVNLDIADVLILRAK